MVNYNINNIKQIINEEYFKVKESALDEVYDAINNLFVYMMYSEKDKNKLNFYIQRFIEALSKLNKLNLTNDKIDNIIQNLKVNFDKEYLKKFEIIKLLEDLKNNDDSDIILNDYVTNIKNNIKKILKNNENINDKLTNDINGFNGKKYLLQIELLKLQEWVIKNNKKVLIIFEGRDGSGKGRNIKKLTEFLNPKHFKVITFGIPTEEESINWFKRYEDFMPKEGEMVFFDRSWYNRGIIEPAMKYCTNEQYNDFMDNVYDFEKNLMNNDIYLIKFWLSISKLIQIIRFELRRIDPLKYWKFSDNDDKILKKWDDLTPFINKILTETNYNDSKWNIIDANNKKKSFTDIIKTILNQFDYDNKDNKLLSKKESIIFLDIHGVLITDIQTNENGEHICDKGWDKEAISNFNHLTDLTKANIVLISTCKDKYSLDELRNMFKRAGVTGNIIDKTISIDKHLREEQIDTWFEINGKPKKWIIIDDKKYDDYENHPDEFVETKPKKGFSYEDLKRALKILK